MENLRNKTYRDVTRQPDPLQAPDQHAIDAPLFQPHPQARQSGSVAVDLRSGACPTVCGYTA